MKANELRQKNVQELRQELLDLRREQFNLRTQRVTNQTIKPHLFGRVRKDIARIKTILREKAGEA